MESILIIGMGRFGSNMALKLSELGCEVLAVDTDEDKINSVVGYVTAAQIGDATNEQFVRTLGVGNFDLCVVAIGDNFQASLEITALVKDLGAQHVLARACSDVHAKFLIRNGADEVAYAEKDMAVRLAVKYSNDSIFDFVRLSPDYSIYEVSVPAKWVGHSIVQCAVRTKYNISVLATKKNGELFPHPSADHVFSSDENIIVLGKNEDVFKLVD